MNAELKTPRFWLSLVTMLCGLVLLLTEKSPEFGALMMAGAAAGYGVTFMQARVKRAP